MVQSEVVFETGGNLFIQPIYHETMVWINSRNIVYNHLAGTPFIYTYLPQNT